MVTTATTTIVPVQPKFIAKSMTFWGALIGLAVTVYQVGGPILSGFGVTVPVTQDDIVAAGHLGSNIITVAGAAVGFGIAVWGRFRAGKTASPISVTPNAAPVDVKIVKPPATPKVGG